MMKKLLYGLFVFALAGLTTIACADAPGDIEKNFKDPPLAMKTIPLWHLNGKITSEGEVTVHGF